MRLIQFIADYGKKDPAFAEVMQRLMMEVPDAVISETSVNPFSTEETGFWTAQFALSPAPQGMIIYTNTAPRKDELAARVANAGEGLVYAKLKNGVEVVGVNSGYSFSLLKDYMLEFWKAKVEISGSQFRSRDFFPKVVGMVARSDYSFKELQLNPADLPEVPVGIILAVDGYGNIKTSWTDANLLTSGYNLQDGAKVKITINGVDFEGFYAGGTFAVKDGEMAFAAGSSGGFAGPGTYCMEVFLRGGSASGVFGHPLPGAQVKITLV